MPTRTLVRPTLTTYEDAPIRAQVRNYISPINANVTVRMTTVHSVQNALSTQNAMVHIKNVIMKNRSDGSVVNNLNVRITNDFYRRHPYGVYIMDDLDIDDSHIRSILNFERVRSIDDRTFNEWVPNTQDAPATETANLVDVVSLGWVDNMPNFQRAYNNAGTEYNIPFRPEGILGDYHMVGVTEPEGRTFGLEIEIDFPNSTDWGFEKNLLVRWMYEHGLCRDDSIRRWHYAARRTNHDGSIGYTRNRNDWTVEHDSSVDGVNGARGCEIVSPILTNTAQTWADIHAIIEKIKDLGGEVTSRTGLHINIGATGSTNNSVTSLIHNAIRYDALYTRLGHNPAANNRHRGRGYCNTPRTGNTPNRLMRDNHHLTAINLTHMGVDYRGRNFNGSGRYEFRIFDGTLDTGRIQHNVLLCMAQIALSMSERPAISFSDPVRTHSTQQRRLTGEAWKNETYLFRHLIDTMGFSEEIAQEITKVYKYTRW